MFEKEAKKWVKENTRIEYSASFGEFPIAPSATKSFTAGAEFGYNKAKEEMQAQIEKMKADYDKLLDEKIELEDRLAESRECY